MGILHRQTNTAGVGGRRHREELEAPSQNHLASEKTLPKQVKSKIASMGLNRVAGNIYEAPSTKDFWQVKGNDIVRLTKGTAVDNGERIAAAPSDAPQSFLDEILGDLTF